MDPTFIREMRVYFFLKESVKLPIRFQNLYGSIFMGSVSSMIWYEKNSHVLDLIDLKKNMTTVSNP